MLTINELIPGTVISHIRERRTLDQFTPKKYRTKRSVDIHKTAAALSLVKRQSSLTECDVVSGPHSSTHVGTYGTEKYTRDGWMSVPDALVRYRNAASRHRHDHYKGGSNHPDSLAPGCWSRLAELELQLRGQHGN